MPKNQNDINKRSRHYLAPFIDTAEEDASTDTKGKTVFGEGIDVFQFATMTAFGEGIDLIAKYFYGIKQYLSSTTIAGLDSLSYLMMIWLSSVRIDKYKQRHDLFRDKNKPEYYSTESDALIAAMTKTEKDTLLAVARACNHPMVTTAIRSPQDLENGFRLFIIDLLKHDAERIDIIPPHTKAKKIILQSQMLFERIRKRQDYVRVKYADLMKAFGLNEFSHVAEEAPSAKAIMYTKMSQELNLSLAAAENLISELTLIEKNWKKTLGLHETQPDKVFIAFVIKQWSTINQKTYQDSVFNHEARLDQRIKNLLCQHGLTTAQSLNTLKHYYGIFHDHEYLHDQNDQNFYKAKERGILAYERERTQTKVQVFSWVRRMSLIAAPLSILIFFAVAISAASGIAAFVPLFLVGTTSLIDEAIDIRYKYQKWKQSIAAMKAWKKDNTFTIEIKGNTVNILDKVKALIEERDRVPEAYAEYSAQELIYLHSISFNDSQSPNDNSADRNVRAHLTHDFEKVIKLFKEGKLHGIKTFINKMAAPLACDEELKRYIIAHEKEINEFRFYEEGYIIGSDEKRLDNFDQLYAAGMRYLESQCKINQQYESRVERRQTKFKQACFSFNGVFWGVLASMAVHILLLSQSILSSHVAMHAFNYVGFITIGIAAVASGIMIKYQLNQNKVKGLQKSEEHYLHMNHLLNPAFPGAHTAVLAPGMNSVEAAVESAKSGHVNTTALLRFSHRSDLKPRTEEEIKALKLVQAQRLADENNTGENALSKNVGDLLKKVRFAFN